MSFPCKRIAFSLLITLCFVAIQVQVAIARPRKVIRVYDLIPTSNPFQPPSLLYAHCQSRSDDLKLVHLIENQNYEFHFRVNFWGTTLYWCDFTWGNRVQSFKVFNAKSHDCDDERYCNWQVKTDGFYFAKGEFPKNSDFLKKFDWKSFG